MAGQQPGVVRFRTDATGFRVVGVDGASRPLLFEDDALDVVDPTDNTKRARFDAGLITAGQTRVFTLPDIDYSPQVSTAPIAVADPGSGAAIPVDKSASIDLTTGAGAETNTLAIPTALGQRLSLVLGTAGGGTRTITASQAINQANNTKMAFTQAADRILLDGVSIAGALRWRVVSNDGVTLS